MIIPNYSQYNEIPHNHNNDYAVSVYSVNAIIVYKI